ncbi:MAG: sigma 54-interacting transcriptional regulator [Candidatus Sumerlaeota bacterium]|nr:sigma 54-interacting transcriptional regulator [Candidatus Sumerlaeota bacterium]
MEKLLVVDDDPAMRLALREVLRRKGYEVLEADGGKSALEILESDAAVRLVLSDVRMPEMTGSELLKIASARYPNLPFIIMTAFGTIEDAVEAMRLGARDYIIKPFTGDAITEAITKALASCSLNGAGNGDNDDDTLEEASGEISAAGSSGDNGFRRRVRPVYGAGKMVFADPLMAGIISLLDEISDSHATVLIEGESGTGKEVLARYLHRKSPRRDKPFVAVNCAALPEGLLESELFGHEKGSFTGAIQSRKGKFELANGGTILLDEISEMPASLQAKILRVLQEHEIDPVGARAPIAIDIRVVATTNRNIVAAVRSGDFREDLYYRLNVINVKVPPLRERPADVIPLAEYFLQKHCKRNHRPMKRLGAEMMEYLLAQYWPGNVREMENFIERAVLLCKDEEIAPAKLFLNPATERKIVASDYGRQGTWGQEGRGQGSGVRGQRLEVGGQEDEFREKDEEREWDDEDSRGWRNAQVANPALAAHSFMASRLGLSGNSIPTHDNAYPNDSRNPRMNLHTENSLAQSAMGNPQSPIGNAQSAMGIHQSVIRNPQSAIRNSQSTIAAIMEEASGPAFVTLEEMERRLILNTLEKVGGNRTRAADLLGVSVRTIRNKLAQYRDPSLAMQQAI